VKSTVDLSAKMERLGTQANVSSEKMAELKKTIFETANAPDIKVDPQAIIGAIDQIIERTGDMKFVEGNIRTIGLAIQATGLKDPRSAPSRGIPEDGDESRRGAENARPSHPAGERRSLHLGKPRVSRSSCHLFLFRDGKDRIPSGERNGSGTPGDPHGTEVPNRRRPLSRL
jgi:hypothetical protein